MSDSRNLYISSMNKLVHPIVQYDLRRQRPLMIVLHFDFDIQFKPSIHSGLPSLSGLLYVNRSIPSITIALYWDGNGQLRIFYCQLKLSNINLWKSALFSADGVEISTCTPCLQYYSTLLSFVLPKLSSTRCSHLAYFITTKEMQVSLFIPISIIAY